MTSRIYTQQNLNCSWCLSVNESLTSLLRSRLIDHINDPMISLLRTIKGKLAGYSTDMRMANFVQSAFGASLFHLLRTLSKPEYCIDVGPTLHLYSLFVNKKTNAKLKLLSYGLDWLSVHFSTVVGNAIFRIPKLLNAPH